MKGVFRSSNGAFRYQRSPQGYETVRNSAAPTERIDTNVARSYETVRNSAAPTERSDTSVARRAMKLSTPLILRAKWIQQLRQRVSFLIFLINNCFGMEIHALDPESKLMEAGTLASHRLRAVWAGFAKKWGDWAAVM